MQRIIEIPEEEYNLILLKQEVKLGGVMSEAEKYIAKGILLPKGHGRLIDADAYKKEMINSRDFDFFKRLDMQPTIIEADKEELPNGQND